VVVASILAMCAGCSSGGSGVSSANRGVTVSPGHGSPEAAVDGILTALKTGHSTAWCAYFNPSDLTECQQDSDQVDLSITGNYSIKSEVVSGKQALVGVTGNLCFHGNATGTTLLQCATNSIPSTGMPPGAGSFSEAYASTANEPSTSLSPIPCIEVSGSWYVNFDILSGTSTTTVPTSTPTSSATTTPTTLAG
jgi:hypothetical protein